MIYILLDNYDEGLELKGLRDFDSLAEFLRGMKNLGDSFNRIVTIIFGEEVPWEVVTEYYHL